MKIKNLFMCMTASVLCGLASCGSNPEPTPDPIEDKYEYSISGNRIKVKLQSESAWVDSKSENNIAKDTVLKFDFKTAYDFGWQLPNTLSITGYESSDFTYTLADTKKTATLEITMKANATIKLDAVEYEESLTKVADVQNVIQFFGDENPSSGKEKLKAQLLSWTMKNHDTGNLLDNTEDAETIDTVWNFVLNEIAVPFEGETWTKIDTSSKPSNKEFFVEAKPFSTLNRDPGYAKTNFLNFIFDTNHDPDNPEYTDMKEKFNYFKIKGDLIEISHKETMGGLMPVTIVEKINLEGKITYMNYTIDNFNLGINLDLFIEGTIESW